MTDYVIWQRGLRGPSLAVLHGSAVLGADDRRRLLSGPTKIAPEHEGEPLSVLARFYPPPVPEDGSAPPDAPAPAPKSPPPSPSAPASAAAVHEAA